jgi:hypothetical protein
MRPSLEGYTIQYTVHDTVPGCCVLRNESFRLENGTKIHVYKAALIVVTFRFIVGPFSFCFVTPFHVCLGCCFSLLLGKDPAVQNSVIVD